MYVEGQISYHGTRFTGVGGGACSVKSQHLSYWSQVLASLGESWLQSCQGPNGIGRTCGRREIRTIVSIRGRSLHARESLAGWPEENVDTPRCLAFARGIAVSASARPWLTTNHRSTLSPIRSGPSPILHVPTASSTTTRRRTLSRGLPSGQNLSAHCTSRFL